MISLVSSHTVSYQTDEIHHPIPNWRDETKEISYHRETRILRVKFQGVEWGTKTNCSWEEILERFAKNFDPEKFRYWQNADSRTFVSDETFSLLFVRMFTSEDLENRLQTLAKADLSFTTSLICEALLQNIELRGPEVLEEIARILGSFSPGSIQHLYDLLNLPEWDYFKAFKELIEILQPYLDLSKIENAVRLVDIGARVGSIDLIQKAFHHHPNLVTDENHWKTDKNPLFDALKYRRFDVAKYLIEQGWDCNRETVKRIFHMSRTEFPLTETLKLITREDNVQNYGEFFIFLLEKGANANLKVTSSITGIGRPMIESCLFYKGKNQNAVHQLVLPLIFHGADVSPRTALRMKEMLKEPFGFYYGHFLREKGLATQEEIDLWMQDAPEEGTSEFYQQKLFFATNQIKQFLLRHRGNWDLIDLSAIEQFKQLKKALKAKPEFHEYPIYQEFVLLYDQLIDLHPLLKELRIASKELRQNNLSTRVIRLYSLWSDSQTYDLPTARTQLASLPSVDRPRTWGNIYHAIITETSKIFSDPFWRRGHISLIHGTKWNPLLKKEGLLPKGELEQRGIVPFSGELSSNPINQRHISCSSLSQSWEKESSGAYFGASTLLLISLIYASQSSGAGQNEKYFDREASMRRTKWEDIESHLEDTREIGVRCVDILRLRSFSSDLEEPFQSLLEKVEKLKSEERSEQRKNLLQLLHQALTIPIRYPLTEDDRVTIEKRIPVIFASMNQVGKPHPSAAETLEFLFEGSLNFGRDLQAAFVPSAHLEEMSQPLHECALSVYDFETAKSLETISMARGSQNRDFEISIQHLPPAHKTQMRIGYYLERDILPKYSIPLPKEPTFVVDGQRIKVPRPFFGEYGSHENYSRAVEDGLVVPRKYHGRMHASRVAILSQLLRNHLGNRCDAQLDPFLMVISAAAHDCQREDEGVDRWDDESAAYLESYLLKLGYPKETALYYSHAIREKDPENRNFTTIVQQLVHDSDCLEIARCLENRKLFRKEELSLQLEDSLIEGWFDFIEQTDQGDLMLALEQHSTNYYADMMRIVGKIAPDVVKKLLSEELSYYDPELLPKEVQEVLQRG